METEGGFVWRIFCCCDGVVCVRFLWNLAVGFLFSFCGHFSRVQDRGQW